jgi:hypothetical protein
VIAGVRRIRGSERRRGGAGSGRYRQRAVRLAGALALGLVLLTVNVTAAGGATPRLRPCDIYALGGTPCVAAYSTTRSLYAGYDGPLYAVRRDTDGRSLRITASTAGYARAGAQTAFCAHRGCVITELFDQSGHDNNLTIAGPGGDGGQDAGVNAGELPVSVDGHRVYGMSFDGAMGYRDDHTQDMATGAQPQTEYMIASGTHTNGLCCFDFGNAETSGDDTGNGHLDAIYYGTFCFVEWPVCFGRGPWVQADLENGLFMSSTGISRDRTDTGIRRPFVTAMLKNNGVNRFSIASADAQRGPLRIEWAGPLPTSPLGDPPQTTVPYAPYGPGPSTSAPEFSDYSPMHQEGAVVLGTGGDDTNGDIGSFFEGAITRGYADDATLRAVQANIVAARYGR